MKESGVAVPSYPALCAHLTDLGLSPAEIDVALALVVPKGSLHVVAEDLYISHETVRKHVIAIRKKLNQAFRENELDNQPLELKAEAPLKTTLQLVSFLNRTQAALELNEVLRQQRSLRDHYNVVE